MEIESVKCLEQLVIRTEALVSRLGTLSVQDDVRIPDAPSAITLVKAEEWIEIADECCKRPKIAESRQILQDAGISAAPIPRDLLEQTAELKRTLGAFALLPAEFVPVARKSLATALTKNFEDAAEVVEMYSAAAKELLTLEVVREQHAWVYVLAANETVQNPGEANKIAVKAKELAEYSDLTSQQRIELGRFDSIAVATAALSEFSEANHKYKTVCATEGIDDIDMISLSCLPLKDAINTLVKAVEDIEIEKQQTLREVNFLRGQLELMGGKFEGGGATLSELKKNVSSLKEVISTAREKLKSSLGSHVFQVVEMLLAGQLPSQEHISDADLGAALRKADECGYIVKMEVPSED